MDKFEGGERSDRWHTFRWTASERPINGRSCSERPSAGPPRSRVPFTVSSCPRADPACGRKTHLWLKQIGHRVVGSIKLEESQPGTVRLAAFRVSPEWYHTSVVSDLIRAIHDHCQEHQCTRLLIDQRAAPSWMPSVLRRYGFQVSQHENTWEAIVAA